ncbi:hypothetical protein GCM10007984_27350 [Shewanella putrefaciens]|uniref:hypothetical protein n=1 Tax=Shewanella putrefaciens TaxID=24 RepID=UPI00046A3D3A|nr:hypothetical protein [Shewanella putrefaciens]GGN25405.1 hypothetical protein GCM10007984_27350 [Shewanella putrefaciens]
MLDAICELDVEQGDAIRVTYSVFTFQHLSEADIERLRQRLFCPACSGKAYFRKASKDGKAACFGSRYHQIDCIEFKPSAQKSREEQDAIEVHQQLVDADALMIDFSRKPRIAKSSTAKSKEHADKTILNSAQIADIEVKKVNADTVQEAPMQYQVDTPKDTPLKEKRVPSQGLEKLLHSLLCGSDLATSNLWVYTDSERKYRWRAKNLFVNFADADPSDNKPHMYWGTISHTDPTMNWLNPADSKDIGIPIDGVKAKLLKQFAIEDKRDLEGAGLILFGKCFWNKEKTRKIIQLWNNDLQRIFISPIED